MTIHTPIAGIPVAELTDTPDAFTLANDIATAVDTMLIPRFTNAAARDAAITAPTEGMACYLTASPAFQLYSSGAWVTCITPSLYGSGSSGVVIQGSDSSKNDNTLTNTSLTFPMAANSVYLWEVFMIYNVDNTSAGFKVAVTGPAGVVNRWHHNSLTASVHAQSGSVDFTSRNTSSGQLGGPDDNTLDCIGRPFGRSETGATSGNWTLQHAQQVTTAGSTHAAIFKARSLVRWWKIV